MQNKFFAALALTALFTASMAAAEPFGMTASTTPTPRHAPSEPRNGWHVRYDRNLAGIKTDDRQVDMLLIGDSITHGWENRSADEVLRKYFPKHKIFNMSHSGDRTEHQLWIVKESAYLNNINPKMTVVLIGTNNIGHNKAGVEATAEGIKLIVKALRERFPETKVLLFGVFPRAQKPDHPYRAQIKAINKAAQKLADGKNVFFCDISALLVEKDGSISKEIMPDYLHLSPKGYTIWAEAILPYAKRFAPVQ